MDSTDRPGRAEQGDRPMDTAERITRYEERLSADRADPAKWNKLDPLARLSPDQLKRLYLPDRTERLPSKSSDDPSRPYAIVDGNTARLVDPAKDIPWTADRDDPKPQSDRMGDRIVNEENDKASRTERMFREGFRAAGDGIEETAKNIDAAKDAMAKPSPPGYVVSRPIQWVEQPRRDGVDTGDAVTATTLGAMLVAYGIWQGMRNWRRR